MGHTGTAGYSLITSCPVIKGRLPVGLRYNTNEFAYVHMLYFNLSLHEKLIFLFILMKLYKLSCVYIINRLLTDFSVITPSFDWT